MNLNQKIMEWFFSTWIIPELLKRGLDPTKCADLKKAQVIFFTELKPPLVRLNDEFKCIIRIKPKDFEKIKIGNSIHFDDIEKFVYAVPIDKEFENCGHITAVRIETQWFFHYDIRPNLNIAHKFYYLSIEFLKVAEYCLANKLYNPLIDNLFSATELLITANLIPYIMHELKSHNAIKTEVNKWSKIGNISKEFSSLFNSLHELRGRLRYLKAESKIEYDEAKRIFDTAKKLQKHVKIFVGILDQSFFNTLEKARTIVSGGKT